MGRGGHSLTAGSFVRLDHEGPQGVDRPETRQPPHDSLPGGCLTQSLGGRSHPSHSYRSDPPGASRADSTRTPTAVSTHSEKDPQVTERWLIFLKNNDTEAGSLGGAE